MMLRTFAYQGRTTMIFSIDLKSFYKSIWLFGFLIVWCIPYDNHWYEVEDFSISFMPD